MKLLDKLGFTASQRARALEEDRNRVMAWLERAQEPGIDNAAAYAWTGIVSGNWPSPRVAEVREEDMRELGAVMVRGSHGLTKKHGAEKSSGPWEVYALNGNDEAMHLVGRFKDLAEARRVYAEHDEKSGATLVPVAA